MREGRLDAPDTACSAPSTARVNSSGGRAVARNFQTFILSTNRFDHKILSTRGAAGARPVGRAATEGFSGNLGNCARRDVWHGDGGYNGYHTTVFFF